MKTNVIRLSIVLLFVLVSLPLAWLATAGRAAEGNQTSQPAERAASDTVWDSAEGFLTAKMNAAKGMDENAASSNALLVRILVAYHSPIGLPAKEQADAFRAMFEDIFAESFFRTQFRRAFNIDSSRVFTNCPDFLRVCGDKDLVDVLGAESRE